MAWFFKRDVYVGFFEMYRKNATFVMDVNKLQIDIRPYLSIDADETSNQIPIRVQSIVNSVTVQGFVNIMDIKRNVFTDCMNFVSKWRIPRSINLKTNTMSSTTVLLHWGRFLARPAVRKLEAVEDKCKSRISDKRKSGAYAFPKSLFPAFRKASWHQLTLLSSNGRHLSKSK